MALGKEMKRRSLRPLPSLDRDWSHWAIFGDDQQLDLLPESEVVPALRMIESNRDRYEAIFVYRAHPSSTPEEFEIQEGRRWERHDKGCWSSQTRSRQSR
jgi:hypothetical protein